MFQLLPDSIDINPDHIFSSIDKQETYHFVQYKFCQEFGIFILEDLNEKLSKLKVIDVISEFHHYVVANNHVHNSQ